MIDISVHILPPIIFAEDFYVPLEPSLYMGFEAFDIFKKFRLVPKKIHPIIS